MPKILIFEPHGDDALISCYHVLKDPENEITIITFSDRSSSKLCEYFSNISETHYLDIPDLHYKYHPTYNTHEVNRKYKNDEDLYTDYVSMMNELIRNIPEYSDASQKALSYYPLFKSFIANVDLVYIPYGLFHPNHFFTRVMVENLVEEGKAYYYAEKPYFEKRYIKQIFYSSISHGVNVPMQIHNFPYQEEDSKFKKKVFTSVYPTEVPMLRYSSDIVLNYDDIYVSKREDVNAKSTTRY